MAPALRSSVLFLLSCVVFGGCVEEESDAAQRYLDLRGNALCSMNFKCCSAEQQQTGTQAECEERGALHTGFQQLSDAVADGTTKIDQAQAERCFADVKAMTCEEWARALAGDVPATCSGIFSGKAEGATCKTNAECSSQFCDLTSGDHTIAAPQSSGLCATPAGAGGSCPAQQDGCEAGLRCMGPDGVPVCTAYPEVGGACDRNSDCVSGVCVDGSCAEACWGAPNAHHVLGTPG
jgi:hypothetical protein